MANKTEEIGFKIVIDGKEVNPTLAEMRGQIKSLKSELDKIPVGTEEFVKKSKELDEVNTRYKSLTRGTKEFREEVSKTTTEATAKNSALLSSVKSLGVGIIAAFSFSAIKGFFSEITAAFGEFQKYEAVLTNTLGDKSAAKQALLDISDFAAKTPFAVSELTASYVKLVNQGFKPSQIEMRKLGDIASSVGKSFDQLAEAVIDAQTGEFERLKEFGIKASKEGDNITFSFKGVSTTVKNTSENIREYITSLGDLQGVSGSMAAISKIQEGAISNLGDSYDRLLRVLGAGVAPALMSVVSAASSFLNVVSDMISPIQSAADATRTESFELLKASDSIQSMAIGTKERTMAIQELQNKYPGYLGNLNAEKVTNEELRKAIDLVNNSLINKIVLSTKEKELTDQVDKAAEKKIALLQAEDAFNTALTRTLDKSSQARRVYQEMVDAGVTKELASEALLADIMDGKISGLARVSYETGNLYAKQQDLIKATNDYNSAANQTYTLEKEQEDLKKRLGIATDVVVQKQERQIVTLSVLREKLKALKEEFESTDINDSAGLANIEKQIVATQKQIEALDGTERERKRKEREKELKEAEEAAVKGREAEGKYNEMLKSEREKERQEKLQLIEIETEEERLRLEQQFFGRLDQQRALEDGIYEIQKNAMERRLSLITGAGVKERGERAKLNADLFKLESEKHKRDVETEQRSADFKRKLKMAELNLAEQVVKFGIELLSKDQESKKKYGLVLKALAFAEIFINLQRELSLINVGTGAAIAQTGIFGAPFATAAGAVQSGIAIGRATLAAASVAGTQFEKGGVTPGPRHGIRYGDSGIAMIDRRTGRELGEMEGGEIILTRGVTQNPALKRAASALNVLGGGRAFAEGGQGPEPTTPIDVEGSSSLLAEMKGLRSDIQALPHLIEVTHSIVDNYKKLREYEKILQNKDL